MVLIVSSSLDLPVQLGWTVSGAVFPDRMLFGRILHTTPAHLPACSHLRLPATTTLHRLPRLLHLPTYHTACTPLLTPCCTHARLHLPHYHYTTAYNAHALCTATATFTSRCTGFCTPRTVAHACCALSHLCTLPPPPLYTHTTHLFLRSVLRIPDLDRVRSLFPDVDLIVVVIIVTSQLLFVEH